MPSGSLPAFQNFVMRYPENPTLKIGAGFALPQVLEELQEYVLKHLLRIGNGDAERQEVTQNGRAKLLKQGNNLVLDPRRL